jgi:hypothetical protein
MNETYKGIDPVSAMMFKLEGLQLGNVQQHDRMTFLSLNADGLERPFFGEAISTLS